MDWLQALIMGIFQGLTEYLPVSSSGHLALAAELLGVEDPEKIMTFTIAVHVATVLSTLVILWKEVAWIFKGLFKTGNDIVPSPHGIRYFNEEQNYALLIIISMIPVGIVGLFFKDQVEAYFSSLMVVGVCLCITATLLAFSFSPSLAPRTTSPIAMHLSSVSLRHVLFCQASLARVALSEQVSSSATRKKTSLSSPSSW